MALVSLQFLITALLLGLVIFVHELGHFMVARWAGVLVERFSIGFGPVLLSIKRGDTEYALSAIPLGGYVKMLGQADTPELDEPSDDQRSYQNKSVGARMAIISAGVIMNVIFGFVCFALAYHLGVMTSPAIVGGTIPGLPAWKAGIQPGDTIVSINGRENVDYENLLVDVMMTNPPSETIKLGVEREGKRLDFDITPTVSGKEKPVIGVFHGLGLSLFPKTPTQPSSPAANATNPPFEGEDLVVAVDGKPVSSYRDLANVLYAKQSSAVTLRVKRRGETEKPGPEVDVRVEPNYVRRLGLAMQIGEVASVQDDSPAALATGGDGKPNPIQAKDVIKAVDGIQDFDPIRIADIITAKAGKKVELTILRPGREQKELKVTVIPRLVPPWLDFAPNALILDDVTPMSIPALGLAYKVLPTIVAVDKDGPAGKGETKLQPGDVVRQVEFFFNLDGKEKSRTVTVRENQWPTVFWAMQSTEITRLRLTIQRPSATEAKEFTVDLTPAADPTWPMWNRGLLFRPAVKEVKVDNILTAITLGMEKTRSSIKMIYMFLRGLVFRTISPQLLGGPITIFKVAHATGEHQATRILFLGILSINLAVINFLPVPVLDGGHMVFLLWELITRRKPSPRVLYVAQIIGLVLIGSLMIFVISMDIFRISQD